MTHTGGELRGTTGAVLEPPMLLLLLSLLPGALLLPEVRLSALPSCTEAVPDAAWGELPVLEWRWCAWWWWPLALRLRPRGASLSSQSSPVAPLPAGESTTSVPNRAARVEASLLAIAAATATGAAGGSDVCCIANGSIMAVPSPSPASTSLALLPSVANPSAGDAATGSDDCCCPAEAEAEGEEGEGDVCPATPPPSPSRPCAVEGGCRGLRS